MATIHPVSRCTTPVETYFNETSLGVSTGFFYRKNKQDYLVTNWHVLTGKNPITGKHLSNSAGEPNRINIWQHRTDGNRQECFLPIEKDGSPLWLQHHEYGNTVDVAILPLCPDDRFVFFPINEQDDPPPSGFEPMVGKELFVLGYPFGKLALELSPYPIWKRASIATELDFLAENRPMFLVDTATRSGMSGSPVVFIAGQFQQFMGVYSGRYGANDLNDIQLGRVWRTTLIPQILEFGFRGNKCCVQEKE